MFPYISDDEETRKRRDEQNSSKCLKKLNSSSGKQRHNIPSQQSNGTEQAAVNHEVERPVDRKFWRKEPRQARTNDHPTDRSK
jgi:hypothetical protein